MGGIGATWKFRIAQFVPFRYSRWRQSWNSLNDISRAESRIELILALNPPVVYSTDRSKAVVPVLVLLFGALWFILRGDLLYVLPCAIFFLCFSVLLALRLPRLGKRELIVVLFVRLIDLCLLGFVGFFFLLMSGKGCGLWLWHSLDFSLTFFDRRYRCDM